MVSNHTPTLRCPNCQYDVSQTLRDGITTCPECGGTIAIDICRERPTITGGLRLTLWLVSSWIIVAIAFAVPEDSFGYFIYNQDPLIMQAFGVIQMVACCTVAPGAFVSTGMWLINYRRVCLYQSRTVSEFVLLAAAWLGVPVGMICIGILIRWIT